MAEIKTLPKKLVDLNPKWVTNQDGDVYGIGYGCPCGLPTWYPQYDGGGKLIVGADGKGLGYAECCPRGGREVVPTKTNFLGAPTCRDSLQRGWDMSGTCFADMSLHPSIHAVDHWHGFLKNGVLESC